MRTYQEQQASLTETSVAGAGNMHVSSNVVVFSYQYVNCRKYLPDLSERVAVQALMRDEMVESGSSAFPSDIPSPREKQRQTYAD